MRPLFKNLRYFTVMMSVLAGITGCHGARTDNSAQCPQSRDTEYAPATIAARTNPLAVNSANLEAGEALYTDVKKPAACATCHGNRGDGKGVLASQFAIAPRDFTCAPTMHSLSDGQLYWIIKNGSVGTNMPAYKQLDDEAIWQLVMYVRQFAPEPLPAEILSSN